MADTRNRGLRAVLLLVVSLAALLPGRAWAFPWFIHHGYVNCAQCHVDPSGAGPLSAYGRAQGEILLRTHYTPMTEEPGKSAEFLFGVLPLPVPLILQADVRSLVIPEPGNVRAILMQADMRAAVQTGVFVASGALGVVSEGARAAQVTTNPDGFNLVSREYWAGVNPAKGWLVRAGRMNLPFGIRTEDHILYTRSVTRTDTNDDQQVGVAASYTSRSVRAEVMGIAGNFQVAPDDFRERGYSGYLSYGISKTAEIGVSSLITHAKADIGTAEPRTRMAHGVFARGAPVQQLAFLGEFDMLHDGVQGTSANGAVFTGIADWEPVQGLHVQGIGQYCDPSFRDPGSVYTAGGAAQWFFAPRVDVRADLFYGTLTCTPGSTPSPLGLVQAHFYL